MPNPNYVDWTFAKTAGARLAPPGPDVSTAEATEIVGDRAPAPMLPQAR